MLKKYFFVLVSVLLFTFTHSIISQTKVSPPTAVNDFDTAELNTTLTVTKKEGVLANDTDKKSQKLTVTKFSVNGLDFSAGQTANFTEGRITIKSDGSYTFVPTAGYTGDVPEILYTIKNTKKTDTASLFLTVERITNLLKMSDISTCNQGYTADGNYKIRYSLEFKNESTARDYHENNLIKNIDLITNFKTAFGNNCVKEIEVISIATSVPTDYVRKPYPANFDNSSINSAFVDGTSNLVFNNKAKADNILYPRQSVYIAFCVVIDPFCNGRPKPTPSGSNVDFNTVMNITSTIGNDTKNLSLTDFHTTEAIVTANLFIPEISPASNPDGTFDYTNTVIIKNEGNKTAQNVNYNMGMGVFLDNGVSFKEHKIRQVSGAPVKINPNYNGDTNSELLLPNNSLPAGGKIVIEVYSLTNVIGATNGAFAYPSISQTQGALDGYDETAPIRKRSLSYVTWSDSLGNHLDTYQMTDSATSDPTSNTQCNCSLGEMSFVFSSSSSVENEMIKVEEAPNGVLEHRKVTFELTVTNTSAAVQIKKLKLQGDFNNVCAKIVSMGKPVIKKSTATQKPNLNSNFNGASNIELFDGTSGLLKKEESITLELTVTFSGDCNGTAVVNFSGEDPLGNLAESTGGKDVTLANDKDKDGISDTNDLDDDNDTIPDVLEYNGLNPTADHDNDDIPNYRDTDYGVDANNDGIIDVFDFDGDGIPNHFDLDSDNDGILDIVEVANSKLDSNNDGRTNNPVGTNGLDNTVENNDGTTASITYTIPNTDNDGNEKPNFLDIDSDNDGIVDNIEAQPTGNYIVPKNKVTTSGIDEAYPNGITPVDTENDGTPDYIDTNSDNDIRDDIIEGWDLDNDGIAETLPSNTDVDNDGLDDAFDKDTTKRNPTNNQTPMDFPNVDRVKTPERDWREIISVVVKINSVSANEGEDFVFTISLVTLNNSLNLIQSETPINITLSTSDGTKLASKYSIATAPFDYNPVTPTVITFPAFQSTAQFTVTTINDNIYELNELFTLNATVTSSNTINTEAVGTGIIISDDLPPTITMTDSRANEGDDLEHTISISHPSSTPINIEVSTTDNTATSPDDYTETKKTVTIDGTIDPNNANLQATFSIPTKTDNINEADEEYLKVNGKVTTNNVGTQDLTKKGTILDINPEPTVVINNATVIEGDTLEFTMQLLDGNSEPMLNYQPITFNLKTVDRTATAMADYKPISVRKSIPAFKQSITIPVKTIDDNLNEETEEMVLQARIISRNVSNSILTIEGVGTIKDNDTPNLFSPNNSGKSDVFRIAGMEDYPNFKIEIFDRWGSKVYSYSNNGSLNPEWWDGKKDGKSVPEGVYYYTLDYNDGKTKPRTNFIELIR